MGMFGNVIFQEGQTVRGLAFMTAALDQCGPADREWLQPMQEQAFSLMSDDERRLAVSLFAADPRPGYRVSAPNKRLSAQWRRSSVPFAAKPVVTRRFVMR